MSISSTCIWECRGTGADTNGGGFVAGGGRTDFSQQDAAQVAVTDAVGNGTTTVTSATAAFVSTHVGNIVYLVGGSGPLAATRRQITSVTNSTTIEVNATVSTGTGITLNLGGAVATLSTVSAWAVDENICYCRGTVLVATTVASWRAGRIEGYGTTRGDNGRATLQGMSAVAIMIGITNNNVHHVFELRNLDVDGNSTAGIAVQIGTGNTQSNSSFHNCLFRDCTGVGVNSVFHGNESFASCSFSGNGGAGYTRAASQGGNASFSHCNFTDNGGTGCGPLSGNLAANNCISSGNTGDGFFVPATSPATILSFCVAHDNTSNGFVYIRSGAGYEYANRLVGCIAYGNGARGYHNPANAPQFGLQLLSCAGGSNTSGNYESKVPVSAFVILTADPFVNAAAGNFALNTTAGGGAACRAAAPIVNAWPGLSTTGFADIGAVQHEDEGGGGGGGGTPASAHWG